jgi:polyhydroxybutyrate depolymerase
VVPERALDPAPLLLVFHGFTGSPADVEEQTGFTELADVHGFLVAYPEGEGRPRSWRADPRRGDRDVEFVRDLVAAISAEVLIDPGRVYAAGMSNGGAMAARLACDASDVIAAVGAVAAPYPQLDCGDSRPVPLIAFHGTADLIVPYDGVEPLMPPVEVWVEDWAGHAGCSPGGVAAPVASDVTLTTWKDCRGDVALYTIIEGRHGWPGPRDKSWWGATTDSVDGSEVIWRFLAERSLHQ